MDDSIDLSLSYLSSSSDDPLSKTLDVIDFSDAYCSTPLWEQDEASSHTSSSSSCSSCSSCSPTPRLPIPRLHHIYADVALPVDADPYSLVDLPAVLSHCDAEVKVTEYAMKTCQVRELLERDESWNDLYVIIATYPGKMFLHRLKDVRTRLEMVYCFMLSFCHDYEEVELKDYLLYSQIYGFLRSLAEDRVAFHNWCDLQPYIKSVKDLKPVKR